MFLRDDMWSHLVKSTTFPFEKNETSLRRYVIPNSALFATTIVIANNIVANEPDCSSAIKSNLLNDKQPQPTLLNSF